MKKYFCRFALTALIFGFALNFYAQDSQPPTRSEWGASAVLVSHEQGKWIIAGAINRVVLDELNLAI